MINIKSDSRKIKKGDIFVALRGINGDGHNYIHNAIEAGCSKVIAEEGTYDIPYEIVPDTRKYLNNYLKDNYKKYIDEMTVIGITGTNGKTTTSYLIYQALNKLGKKCAYIGTIGYYLNKLEYPLENTSPDVCDIYDMIINAYDNDYRFIVLEVSSHGLSFNRFSNIHFDYAFFTNLSIEHLDYYITMKKYAEAKQQLFKKCTGINIINNDDLYKDYFMINNYITYGFSKSDYNIIDYKLNSRSTIIKIKHNKKIIEIKSYLIGKYNIYNILCTYILLDLLKFNTSDIVNILSKVHSPEGRMKILKYNNNTIIIDYAHTPDAMENVYKTVKDLKINNIYTVFGCTGDRERTKRPIMMKLACTYSKKVIVTSDDLHTEDFNNIIDDMIEGNEYNNYEIIEDRGKAIRKGIKFLKDNDMLLILGKGHEKFIILKDRKLPFNDLDEVNKILNDLLVNN